MERLAKLEALREALVWWDECSTFIDSALVFWFGDDSTNELVATNNAAWAEVERLLQETER